MDRFEALNLIALSKKPIHEEYQLWAGLAK